ncbi:hypothetical protein O0L34_g4707 [Tuta absoluta]|nr:hypothetical protein O0L34_g8471 [Tuta absoluta]KAJ2945802.1 hypothetical protein O0L34_g4707 [Tuta absoluta]
MVEWTETPCRMTSYTDIPKVVISPKTRQMFPVYSQNVRLFVLIFAALVFLYTTLLLRAMYIKDQRLDRISDMLSETGGLNQDLIALKRMDERLADDIDKMQHMLE